MIISVLYARLKTCFREVGTMMVDQRDAIYGGEKADCFGLVRPPALAITKKGWRIDPPLMGGLRYFESFLVDDASLDGLLAQTPGNRDAVMTVLHVVSIADLHQLNCGHGYTSLDGSEDADPAGTAALL